MEKEFLNYAEKNLDRIVKDIERVVKAESPSHSKTLVDKCGKVIQELFYEHLDITAEIFKQSEYGDHLKFTYGSGEDQILVIGHFDTVWNEGQLKYHKNKNKIYGPGVLDMKGGIIQTLWAVKALKDFNEKLNKKIVFLCNSDEEIGSHSSRDLIESEAKKSSVVLVPEMPVSKTGALKTARKGTGSFTIKVKGVSSHAGNHHQNGVNAIEELSHQIIKIQDFTDYEKGITVNVGKVSGGTRINVVPDEAEAHIDFRVRTEEDGHELMKEISSLEPVLEGVEMEVSGEMNRPPMERTDEISQLFQKAKIIAEELGFELKQAKVGGGSDGNFTAALGIPTLDGLGAVGSGPHAENEHIIISEIPFRTALISTLLTEL